MSKVQTYYDRLARNYSLNSAIAFTVVFTFVCSIGFFQFIKYLQQHDPFYLFIAPVEFVLGAVGIFHGAQVTHAVVRRLLAGSRQPQ